ncbi:MAG: glycosyltransferase family 4 protein [Actinomycetota bacterium]|nr:glycosyltransferase family 4 protein [Actinomycetota bacterium]
MFTPVRRTSGIGRSARLVIRALRRGGHDVAVVSTDQHPVPVSESVEVGFPVTDWRDTSSVAAVLATTDLAVYQIGDNYEMHAGAVEWMAREAGVVCLHDSFLGNLFLGWASERPRDEADRVLDWFYGAAMPSTYWQWAARADFIERTYEVAPLTEWISAQALAVVSHSRWVLPRVLGACAGRVEVADLAWEPRRHAPAHERRPDAPLTLLTVGHVNDNKRVRSVLRAIATSDILRHRLAYRVVGLVHPATADDLRALAHDLGVQLRLDGEVNEATLDQAMADADIVAALRWPCLEAASASTIEAMLAAKPTIVTRAGFYAELPPDCVAMIDPDDEIAQLTATLERMVATPAWRHELGSNAAAHSAQTFTADRYAEQLVNVCAAALLDRIEIDAITHAARTLARWGLATANPADEFIFPPTRMPRC